MEKDKNKKSSKNNAAIGAGAGFSSSLISQYAKEHKKLKDLSKIKNNKKIDAFMRSLKPGDILLDSDPKGFHAERIFTNKDVKSLKKRFKVLQKTGFPKQLQNLNFNNIISGASGGTPFYHASIYLGNGKIAETPGESSQISNLKDKYRGKRIISLRVSDDSKIQKGIAKTARNIASGDILYRPQKDIIKQALLRNVLPIKKGFDGTLTCTELVAESVETATGKKLGGFISNHQVDPGDIFFTKKAKFAAKYNFSGLSRKEKLISFIGKGFRSGKYAIIGAGVGAGATLAYNLYHKDMKRNKITENLDLSGIMKRKSKFDTSKKGKWVTSRGRRFFIPDKK